MSEDAHSATGAYRRDVLTVGSWTFFDHLFAVERLPFPGETVRMTGSVAALSEVFHGGCSANNAVAVARLGGRVALMAVAGGDFLDSGYRRALEAEGVDLSRLRVLPAELCGHSYLFTQPDGKSVCISHVGPSPRQSEMQAELERPLEAAVVLINYMFDEWSVSVAEKARGEGSAVICSGDLAGSDPERVVKPLLRAATLISCTVDEFDALQSLLDARDGNDVVHAYDLDAAIVTHGTRGTEIHRPAASSPEHVPAVESAHVVDSVGAGDSFVAGVAYATSQGLDLTHAVRVGATVASLAVEGRGAQTALPDFETFAGRYAAAYGEVPGMVDRRV
jgi:sugar/nucleoside kinase (ribokinase family)